MATLLEVLYSITIVSALAALGFRLLARRRGPAAQSHLRRARVWAALAAGGAVACAILYWSVS